MNSRVYVTAPCENINQILAAASTPSPNSKALRRLLSSASPQSCPSPPPYPALSTCPSGRRPSSCSQTPAPRSSAARTASSRATSHSQASPLKMASTVASIVTGYVRSMLSSSALFSCVSIRLHLALETDWHVLLPHLLPLSFHRDRAIMVASHNSRRPSTQTSLA